MAGYNERRIFDRREDINEGHGVKWELSVGDLVHLQSWPFSKTYKTFCQVSPTTWRFEMSLSEIRDDDTCSLSVLLERTDPLDIELEACIWIHICDPNDDPIFKKQSFTKDGMLPGNLMQKTFELTPLPDMTDAIHRNPKICISIVICNCHSDIDPASFLRRRRERFSPMHSASD